jgi:hypothetical protein
MMTRCKSNPPVPGAGTRSTSAHVTHRARITGPVPYYKSGGKASRIPLGPCIVEQADRDLVDIVWGATGQNCAALPIQSVKNAASLGHLVLLD